MGTIGPSAVAALLSFNRLKINSFFYLFNQEWSSQYFDMTSCWLGLASCETCGGHRTSLQRHDEVKNIPVYVSINF